MNNPSQAFADGKFPPPDPSSAAACSPSTAHVSEPDNIRQAQREWRLAKRRELEAKARKKIRRTTLPVSNAPAAQQLPHTQPPHVHAAALYNQIPTANPASPHQVHIAHGAVFVPPSDVQPVHVQPIAHSQPIGTAALHQVNQPHPAVNSPLKPDPDQAVVIGAALQTHLNANAKRPRSAIEEAMASSAVEDAEGVAAVNAAAVHAAASASPGDAQFASSIPMPTGVGAVVAAPLVTDAHLQQQQDAHQRAMIQYEAQRKWREMKRKEIAMKKAKGAGSKRGRKKSRVEIIQPAHSDATAQLQASVSMAIAGVPSAIETSEHVQGDMPAEDSKDEGSHDADVGVNGQGVEEDPAAMYVEIVPPAEPAKDLEEPMKGVEQADENMPPVLPDDKTSGDSVQQPEVQSTELVGGEKTGQQEVKREDPPPTEKASDQVMADAGGHLTSSNGGEHDDGNMDESSDKPKAEPMVNPGDEAECEVPGQSSDLPADRALDQTIQQAIGPDAEQPSNQATDQPAEHPVDMEMPISDEAEIAAQRVAEAAEQSVRAAEAVKDSDDAINLTADEAADPDEKDIATGDAVKDVSDVPATATSPLVQGESKDLPKAEDVTTTEDISKADGPDSKGQMEDIEEPKPKEETDEVNVTVKIEPKPKIEVETVENAKPKQLCSEGEKRVKDDKKEKKEENMEHLEQKPCPSVQSGAGPTLNETAGAASVSGTGVEEEKDEDDGAASPKTSKQEESPSEAKQSSEVLETKAASDGQRPQDSNSLHEGETEAKADEFSGVNGEDIMTAAAWQSLDSISNP